MNFRHDFAEMAREEFRNLGMSVPKEWDDYEICIKLFQVLQRHINSNIPYYVLYSKELLQKLPYLPESDRREIKRIEWCLRNCQSITEYMSRDINTTSMRKSDFMLKNWEIYHVHLEKVQKNKKCTNPHLLFFQIANLQPSFWQKNPFCSSATSPPQRGHLPTTSRGGVNRYSVPLII